LKQLVGVELIIQQQLAVQEAVVLLIQNQRQLLV
jgi:hypothetical protein